MRSESEERRNSAIAVALFAGITVLIGADLVADYAEGTSSSHVLVEASAVALALLGAVGFAQRALRLAREKRRLEDRARSLEGETRELRGEARELRGVADQLRGETEALRGEADQLRDEADDLRSRLSTGLTSAIDRQFEAWQLTIAEREVGLLLLKGLSHQEIADLRQVSERTVRQQSRAIYKKAGLSGRADLSAYFIEDFLVVSPPDRGAR